MPWNRWPHHHGIDGHMRVEYATALAMVFRLMMSAKKKWRKISGPNRLPEVIQGVEFKDGIKQPQTAA